MEKMSSLPYFGGFGHKDLFFNGRYHKAACIGNALVWEKLGLAWEPVEIDFGLEDNTKVVYRKVKLIEANGKVSVGLEFTTDGYLGTTQAPENYYYGYSKLFEKDYASGNFTWIRPDVAYEGSSYSGRNYVLGGYAQGCVFCPTLGGGMVAQCGIYGSKSTSSPRISLTLFDATQGGKGSAGAPISVGIGGSSATDELQAGNLSEKHCVLSTPLNVMCAAGKAVMFSPYWNEGVVPTEALVLLGTDNVILYYNKSTGAYESTFTGEPGENAPTFYGVPFEYNIARDIYTGYPVAASMLWQPRESVWVEETQTMFATFSLHDISTGKRRCCVFHSADFKNWTFDAMAADDGGVGICTRNRLLSKIGQDILFLSVDGVWCFLNQNGYGISVAPCYELDGVCYYPTWAEILQSENYILLASGGNTVTDSVVDEDGTVRYENLAGYDWNYAYDRIEGAVYAVRGNLVYRAVVV